MAPSLRLLLFTTFSLLASLSLQPPSSYSSFAASCLPSFAFLNQNLAFTRCLNLSTQNSSVAWNYNSSNRTLDVLFMGEAPASGGWVGWGINPSAAEMAGTQAFIAFQASNGSTILTYNVTQQTKFGTALACTPISLDVLSMAVQISGGTSIWMLVSIRLQPELSASALNLVWNRGSAVSNFQPGPHSTDATDLQGLRTVDVTAAVSASSPSSAPPATGESPPVATTPSPSTTADCPTSYAFGGENKIFSMCRSLSVQGGSIAWTYQEAENRTLEVLFVGEAPASGGWVGWGINPDAAAMVGTQAFIAFQASNGSTILTYDITQQTKLGAALACTPISLDVISMAVQISGTTIWSLVSLRLQPNQSTSLNLVWNRGSTVSNFQPGPHSTDSAGLSSMTTLDVSTGSASGSASAPRQTLKNRHGVLNVVGWGILLPIGVMAARYLRFADPAWFYAHVGTQLCGYALGVAGWGTGIHLGSQSVGVVYDAHRNIGIVLFSLATLQILALLVRPDKQHKIRCVWNFYHYAVGVSILVLGIVNIFEGFDILSPDDKWRRAYVGVLIALGALALVLEVGRFVHRRWLGHHRQLPIMKADATPATA